MIVERRIPDKIGDRISYRIPTEDERIPDFWITTSTSSTSSSSTSTSTSTSTHSSSSSSSSSSYPLFGVEMTPDNTAVSDNTMTEADSVGTWAAKSFPDTFESTSSGSPAVGSYHFHVINTAGFYRGFRLDNLTFEAGHYYRLRVRYKVASGSINLVVYNGDGSYLSTPLIAGSSTTYVSREYLFSPNMCGSSGSIVFETNNTSGEFYCDDISLREEIGITTSSSSSSTTTSSTVLP